MYFKQAKIVLYKKDKSLQKDLHFNVTSSDGATWFWHSKLKVSSWDDIEKTHFTGPDRKSVFSTVMDKNKLFVIGKKEIKETCDLKEGWLKVIDHGGRCANFPIKETPGIYYSKKTTATLWSKGTNGPLKRQKNWAWTSGKCRTDRIILPVYRDNNLLKGRKKSGPRTKLGKVAFTRHL